MTRGDGKHGDRCDRHDAAGGRGVGEPWERKCRGSIWLLQKAKESVRGESASQPAVKKAGVP